MISFKDLKYILGVKKKITYYFLFLAIIFCTLLEIFGIGLLIPVLKIITDQSFFNEANLFFKENLNYIFSSEKQLIFSLLLLLITVFIIKSFFSLFLQWFTNKVAYSIEENICNHIYTGFLTKPYKFHLQQNTAKMIQNFIVDSQILSWNLIVPLIKFFAETFILIGLLILLFISNPGETLYILLISLSFIFIYFYFTKNFVLRWGTKKEELDGDRIKNLQETILAIKELKISKLEKIFENKFRDINLKLAKYTRYHNTGLAVPQILLELTLVLVVCSYLFYLNYLNYSISIFLPSLALYVIVGLRALPTINRILVSLQQIKFALPVIPKVSEAIRISELKDTDNNSNLEIINDTFNNIELKNINFSYEKNNKEIIKNNNLKFNKGDIIGIKGTSGSGKSTLVKIFLGLLEQTSGEIIIDNKIIKNLYKQYSGKILYLSQDPAFFNDNFYFNISLTSSDPKKLDKQKIKHVLENVDFDFLKFSSDQNIDVNYNIGELGSSISGGQKQKLALARAYYFRPNILVLDEATNAMDSEMEIKILENLIRNIKCDLIIMISHNEKPFKFCNKVYDINKNNFIK